MQKLGSSRSGRRFGSIAEWTNNQHSCKVRRDCLTGERDGISSSHGSGEVHKDCAVNKNLHQQPEKKENSKPSKDPDVKCVNGELSKVPAQVLSLSFLCIICLWICKCLQNCLLRHLWSKCKLPGVLQHLLRP